MTLTVDPRDFPVPEGTRVDPATWPTRVKGAYKSKKKYHKLLDEQVDELTPMARAVVRGEIDRGVAICGSGVGACVVANKVPGVRACLIHETFSARQGVEDDDLNVICLGGLVVGKALGWELLTTFLAARFSGAELHRRRLAKVSELEREGVRS